jgi:hypothetical protein
VSQRRNLPRGHDFYMDVWHRKDSLQRFVGPRRAGWMSQIDIDCCEYCHLGGCLEPVALIETKLIMSTDKTVTVTKNLARRAELSGGCYLVEYETTKPPIVCYECGRPDSVPDNDIAYFIVTDGSLERGGSVEKTPVEYAEWLWSLRIPHWDSECTNPARLRMLGWLAGDVA